MAQGAVGPRPVQCLNCGRGVDERGASAFAGVVVCDGCHVLATRLYQRCEGELRRLLLMLQEGIRIALVEGKLQYDTSQLEEVSKKDLLQAIVSMTEKTHGR